MSEPTQPKTLLVWNKGIAALCDRRFPDEFPNGQDYIPAPTLAGALFSSALPDNVISGSWIQESLREGDLVWVRLSWLKAFIRRVLPLVQARIVLVTGDSDSCVPSELRSEARTILGSPKVIHWFAQNYDGTLKSDRISPLPIGIDFHTLSEKPCWGEDSTPPAHQEEVLRSIVTRLAPVKDRLQKVYVDFAWQRSFGVFHYRRYHPLKGTTLRQSRRWIARKMGENTCVFCQARPLPRTQMWQERGRYAFVLSPHGMGLDCHRTWEALALGHIVLVPSSSLDPLYDGLPVVPLKSWSDITSESLSEWSNTYSEKHADEKLRSEYWIDRMRSVASDFVSHPLRLRCTGDGSII
jgi:hypothetical protein